MCTFFCFFSLVCIQFIPSFTHMHDCAFIHQTFISHLLHCTALLYPLGVEKMKTDVSSLVKETQITVI